jgi:splicing factor 3B subunit 5
MADKLRTLQNLEALQARYIGTGHADTTKYEWVSNILRDSYSSYIGHPPLLSYMAVGLGEPKEKVRAMMIDKMIRGAGNPPEVRLPVHYFDYSEFPYLLILFLPLSPFSSPLFLALYTSSIELTVSFSCTRSKNSILSTDLELRLIRMVLKLYA